MHGPSLARLLSIAALSSLPGQPGASAQDNQFAHDVRTLCSQYDLGQYSFWVCDSTISYIDAIPTDVLMAFIFGPRDPLSCMFAQKKTHPDCSRVGSKVVVSLGFGG